MFALSAMEGGNSGKCTQIKWVCISDSAIAINQLYSGKAQECRYSTEIGGSSGN